MALLGLRGSGDFEATERPKNFRETILWRDPNGMAPITGLLSKMRKEATNDPEFNWYEEQLDQARIKSTAALIGDTAITLYALPSAGATADGTFLVAGDLLLNESTNEILQVATVTSATAITVARGAAGSTAVAITDLDFLLKIGNVYSEGSNSPNVTSRNPTRQYNLCQIFKTAYEMTGTVAAGLKLRTGDPLKNDKKRKMFDHAVAMEQAIIHGRRFEDTDPVTGKPRRYMGGIRQFVTTNVTTAFTATTPLISEFIAATAPVFDYKSQGAGNTRLIMAGNGALMALNRIAAANSTVQQKETIKLYGMELTRWIIPQGSFYVRTHPLLNTHPVYTNTMLVLDPSNMIYRPYRDTRSMDNIQANDADTKKGQWLTEAGIEIEHEGTFAILDNFGA